MIQVAQREHECANPREFSAAQEAYTAGCWQRDAGFRIDHLLCSPEAADRLQSAGVDK